MPVIMFAIWANKIFADQYNKIACVAIKQNQLS